MECPMSSGFLLHACAFGILLFLMLSGPCASCLHLVCTCQHGGVTPNDTQVPQITHSGFRRGWACPAKGMGLAVGELPQMWPIVALLRNFLCTTKVVLHWLQVVRHGACLMHSRESCSRSATTPAPSASSIPCPAGQWMETNTGVLWELLPLVTDVVLVGNCVITGSDLGMLLKLMLQPDRMLVGKLVVPLQRLSTRRSLPLH